MHRTYEAICEGDRLEWLGERPSAGRRRVLVTVLDNGASSASSEQEVPSNRKPRPRSSEEVRRILDETRGAWGDKSADEIDREIEEMRKEWDRPWYPEVADDPDTNDE